MKSAGYAVAATYGGNDDAAQKFRDDHGIAVYRWDVGDFDACKQGIGQVEADLGPIDVLVNNAGITRDGTLHRMKPEDWRAVIATNLDSLFNMTRNVIEGLPPRSYGPHHPNSPPTGPHGQFAQANQPT